VYSTIHLKLVGDFNAGEKSRGKVKIKLLEGRERGERELARQL
jgi:hypothetical protein